jgi:hypothetical protein
VSAAFGGAFEAGKPFAITPETPTCIYDSQAAQVRVNITWIKPSQVEGWVANITRPLAGNLTAIAGDPNNAYFQHQGGDMNMCAIVFVKGNLQYGYLLMPCRDPASAQTGLTALPRP